MLYIVVAILSLVFVRETDRPLSLYLGKAIQFYFKSFSFLKYPVCYHGNAI